MDSRPSGNDSKCMEVKAKLNNLRIAPRKTRLVADLVRNKTVMEAESILNFTVKKASLPILKLLNSAVSNAKNNFQLDKENLFVSKITVDGGPMLKRWMPRARGRASEIMKRTSHVTLMLSEIKGKEEIKATSASDKSTASQAGEAKEKAVKVKSGEPKKATKGTAKKEKTKETKKRVVKKAK